MSGWQIKFSNSRQQPYVILKIIIKYLIAMDFLVTSLIQKPENQFGKLHHRSVRVI